MDDFYRKLYDECCDQHVEAVQSIAKLSAKLEMKERELEIVYDILYKNKEKTVDDILFDIERASGIAFKEMADKILGKPKD